MFQVKAHVVGYGSVDFTDEKTNKHFDGTSVWLLQEVKGFTGKKPLKVFLKDFHGELPLGDCFADVEIGPSGRLNYIKFYK